LRGRVEGIIQSTEDKHDQGLPPWSGIPDTEEIMIRDHWYWR
jgi:hypothetical protein